MNPTDINEEQVGALVDGGLSRNKLAVSRLISLFEDQRPSALPLRAHALQMLADASTACRAPFIGVTGTPGAGKSSLLGCLAMALADREEGLSCAVVAVDPSSHLSRGAFLGDRTRVRFPVAEGRLFFRSQASATELGGIGPWTFQVCRLLHYLFDCVFIETVGIGQSEIGVRYLADRMYLVMQPMAGDEVQFLKAGIMEVPDATILNKCDEEAAAMRSYHALRASLALARPVDGHDIPIHRASAKLSTGIAEIADEITAFVRQGGHVDLGQKERHHFDRWVADEWGRNGLRLLEQQGHGTLAYLRKHGNFDSAQAAFHRDVRTWLRSV